MDPGFGSNTSPHAQEVMGRTVECLRVVVREFRCPRGPRGAAVLLSRIRFGTACHHLQEYREAARLSPPQLIKSKEPFCTAPVELDRIEVELAPLFHDVNTGKILLRV